MGWLWASSPAKQAPATDSNKPDASASTKQTPAPNDLAADPEIQKFLDLFKGESSDPKQSPPSSAAPQQQQSSSSSSSSSSISSWLALKASRTADETPNAPPHDRVSESLLPTEMSCRQAFDLAWSCNSLGGQWNAVYRQGEMRSCSEQWDDFWFCMRTKSHTGETKARAVRQHYRNKEHAKYYAPGKHSSEDIWEIRDEKLPWGSAFAQPIDAAQVDDDEWRRQESERRKGIREGLGYDKATS